MRDTERERERDRGRSRLHAGSPTWDSILGLDPGTPGLRPGPKAGAKPLSHPGIPKANTFVLLIVLSNKYGRQAPWCDGKKEADKPGSAP